MADAIITDINEYRARKNGSVEVFKDWSDKRIKTRYDLLSFVVGGNTDLIDMSKPFTRLTFPEGYDPIAHAEDNIDTVYAEGLRRGVFVASE